MGRLIDGDKLIEDLRRYRHENISVDGLEGIIALIPSANPEQKTGKWKPWKAYYGKDHKSWSDELKCSECGYKWGDEEYKFCPMCGAEMEEPDE